MMQRTQYEVALEGVNVKLTIGDKWYSMDYDTANKIAVLLYGFAKKAKGIAGDGRTAVYGFADLTDAVLDELKAQKSRDGTAAFRA
jgi:hypothetical protein